MTAAPHPRFPVQGCVLSTGGDTHTYTHTRTHCSDFLRTEETETQKQNPQEKEPKKKKKKLRNTQASIVQNSPGQKKVNIEDRIPRRKKPEGGRKKNPCGWLAGWLPC
jgi:hypothetical protein